MKNVALFIGTTLIWGSTWFAITFQVADTDPLVSVTYRFLAAGLLLLLYCTIKGRSLRFSAYQHGLMLLQGLFLFGFNYWLVYIAEETLTSGLVGLIFSTLVFMNILNSRIFLKEKFEATVILAAILGVVGISLVFQSDLATFSFSNQTSIAITFSLLGAFIASLGNIIAAYNQKQELPMLPSTAFSMMYGALAMGMIALLSGKSFYVELSTAYLLSFLFLTLFGSIIAFIGFFTLLERIGVNRSGYIALVSPVLALVISTLFEGYDWSVFGLLGIVLIVIGNILVLRVKARAQQKKASRT